MPRSELDTKSICRACAGPFHGEQMHLMETPEVLEMFLMFSATQVDRDDNLPKSICSNCNGRLEDCKRFQDMCITSYKFLLDCFPTECNDEIKSEECLPIKYEEKVESNDVEEIYEEEIACDILDDENDDSDSKQKNVEFDPLNDSDLFVNKEIILEKLQNVDEVNNQKTVDSDDDEILADLVRKSKQKRAEERSRQEGNRRLRRKWIGKRGKGIVEEIQEVDIKKLKSGSNESQDGYKEESDEEGDRDKSMENGENDEDDGDEDYDESKEDIGKDGKKHKKPRSYACNKCPKTFLKKEIYEGHMRQHEGLKPFECDKCHKKYSRFERLTNHKLSDHSDEPKRYCCEIAGCDRKYRNRETLQRHVRAHFTPPMPRPDKSERQVFICELCGKQLSTKGTLREHEMMHKGEYPYACDVCPKRFRVQHKLYLHKLRHQGVKNFKCEICGLKKTTNKELKSHMNIHTREKQYPCRLCDAIFLANGNLVRHVQVVHDGIKLYACSYCDKAFGKAETLRNHTMKHTGERPLMCPHCDRRFISRTSLQYHIRRHEKDATEGTSAASKVKEKDIKPDVAIDASS